MGTGKMFSPSDMIISSARERSGEGEQGGRGNEGGILSLRPHFHSQLTKSILSEIWGTHAQRYIHPQRAIIIQCPHL